MYEIPVSVRITPSFKLERTPFRIANSDGPYSSPFDSGNLAPSLAASVRPSLVLRDWAPSSRASTFHLAISSDFTRFTPASFPFPASSSSIQRPESDTQ